MFDRAPARCPRRRSSLRAVASPPGAQRSTPLVLALALGLAASLSASANTSTDIINHITYSAPNTYTYTTKLLDYTRMWGSPDPIVVTHSGGTVNANVVSLSNGIVYNKSGGTANFNAYTVIACYSMGAVAATLNHSGGELTTPIIRLACFNGNNGKLTLSGGQISTDLLRLIESTNSAQATVNLNGGVLNTSSVVRVGNDAYQSIARLNFNGGTLRARGSDNASWLALDNGYSYLNNLTLVSIGNGGAFFDTNGRSMGIGIRLPGSGGITKLGAGSLTLSADNAYSGPTVVDAGALRIATPNAVAPSTVVINGGQVEFVALGAANFGGLGGGGNLVLQNTDGQPLNLAVGGNGANTTYTGALSGSGSLIKQGGGTLSLSGISSYSGGTTVSGGTLVLAGVAGNGIGSVRGALTINAGARVTTTVVDAAGWANGMKLDSVAISAGTLDNTSAGSNGWGIAYALNGATLRSNGGTGSVTAGSHFSFGGPSNANTSVAVAGATPSTISGRIDLRGEDGNSGNTAVNFSVAAGARLDVSAGISSAGSHGLNKVGTGVMALQFANNTYAGATQVTAGTLLVNGSTGTGAVTVASGATLSGTGQVRGSTTVHSGGRIAPGDAVGTLTFSNGLTLNNGAVFNLDLGTNSDQIRISGGSFTGSGSAGVTLNVSDSGGFGPGSYTLFDFAGATASGVGAGDFALGSVIPGPYDYAISVGATRVSLVVTRRDIEAPIVSSIGVPASRLYRAGEALDFVVTFNEPVFVSGTPGLPLVLDSGNVGAGYVSGSGSSSLLFRYVTSHGDTDANGIALGNALVPNGGGLADAANNAAVLALNGTPSTSGIRIDTTAPAVLSIAVAGSPAPSSSTVEFAVQFSESVEGVDAADFALATTTGTAAGEITQLSGSGANYVVTVSDITGYGQLRVDLRSSDTGITDVAGNPILAGFTAGGSFAADAARPLCHVDADAQGLNTGASWQNAYTDLQSALSAAVRCEAIWMAGGVYRAGSGGFAIGRPVRIHGGFAGNETQLAERTDAVIAAHPTVLSGDVDGDDAVDAQGIVVDAADQVGSNRSVVVDLIAPPYSASDTVLDGLIITGAASHGLRCLASGAGQTCSYRLTNAVFSGNSGLQGAALVNEAHNGGDASPSLDRVLFRGNHAAANGAVLQSVANGQGTLASPTFLHVLFTGNRGNRLIGTIAEGGTAQPDFNHVVLYNNPLSGIAPSGILNEAANGGSAHMVLRNSIVWTNAAVPVRHLGSATAAFGHSILQGFGDSGAGWVGAGSDLGGNRDAGPVLGSLGNFGGAIPGLRPGAGSAAIDAGDGCASADYRGIARPQGAACDIGTTEVRQHLLDVTVQGAGTVVSATPAIGAGFGECGSASSACTAHYPEQTAVSLIATPASHAHLLGWSGDCDPQGAVVIDSDRQCTATFANNTVAITLSRSIGSTPAAYGTALEFTATLTPTAPASAPPTGTVHFYSGATLLGSASLDNGVARLQASTLLGVGSHAIEARYLGDSQYLATAQAPSNGLSQQIVAATGTLLFGSLTFTYDGGAHSLNAELAEDPAAVCVLTPAQIGPDAGSYAVSASCSGDQYTATGTTTAVIGRATGTVEFEALTFTDNGSAHAISAHIAEEPTSSCSLSPAVIGPGAGSHPVAATCIGMNYQASASAVVEIAKAVGTVEFTALSFTYDTSPQQPAARIAEEPASTCSVTPTSIGPGAGDWPVSADCIGANYRAAGTALANIARASQSIDFPAPGEQALTQPHVELSATASSGLPVNFSVSPATVCTSTGAHGASVSLHAVGSCTVRASQPGDANHTPAAELVRSFTVIPGNTPPRILAPGAQSMLEDSVLDGLVITLEDDQTAASALSLAARSSDPTLIADSGLQLLGTGATRTLRITPLADAFGTATITLTVSDGEGLSTDAQLEMSVLPVNDAPTLALSTARLVHAAGSPGAQSVPAFASANPGPANESGQSLSYTLATLADPHAVLGASSIAADGRLRYTLTGQPGEALLRLTVTDNGGQANGGVDQSHLEFRIVVTSGADVVLRIHRRLPAAMPPSPSPPGGTSTVEYAIEATNHGPSAVTDTTLAIRASAALGSVLWLCDPPAACTPASGSLPGTGPHTLATALTLGTGQTATLTLSGGVDSNAQWLELAAEAVLPEALRPTSGNPRVVLIEPISTDALFRDGFE